MWVQQSLLFARGVQATAIMRRRTLPGSIKANKNRRGSDLLLPMRQPWDAADIALAAPVCSLMLWVPPSLLRTPTPLAGLAGFRPAPQSHQSLATFRDGKAIIPKWLKGLHGKTAWLSFTPRLQGPQLQASQQQAKHTEVRLEISRPVKDYMVSIVR